MKNGSVETLKVKQVSVAGSNFYYNMPQPLYLCASPDIAKNPCWDMKKGVRGMHSPDCLTLSWAVIGLPSHQYVMKQKMEQGFQQSRKKACFFARSIAGLEDLKDREKDVFKTTWIRIV